jgi:hypothetical protein
VLVVHLGNGRRVDLAEQLGDLGLDLVVEALPQPVGVLGELLHDLGRDDRRLHALDLHLRVSRHVALLVFQVVLEVDELDPEPVDGAGEVLGVGGGDGGEPGSCQVVLALHLQDVGVCRREPHPARVGSERGWVGAATERALENQARSGFLPQVQTRAGLHDAQFEGLVCVGVVGEGLGDEPQRDVGAAQGPLAVGEDGPVSLVATHPAVGPDLPGGLGEVTSVVRGDADGLADSGHARRSVTSSARMGQGGLGLLVDEAPGGDEMRGDALGIAGVEATQGAADRRVELPRVDPLGDFRAGRQRRTAILAVGTWTRGGPPMPITGRTAVLPGAARSTVPMGTATGRAVALRTTVAPLSTRARTIAGRPIALGTTVLPLRPVTRGAVALRTTVLPLRTVDGRPVTPRRTRTLRPITLQSTVLPLRTVAGRPVTLRTTVLPLRAIAGGAVTARRTRTLRPVTLRAAVLPLRAVTRGAVTARRTRTLRTVAGRPVTLRATVLPLGTIPGGSVTARRTRTLGTIPLRPAVLPLGTVAGGSVTARRPRSLRPVTLRTTVLPLGTVARGTTVLPVTSGRRPIGTVPLGPAVLPAALFVTRRSAGATATAAIPVTLRTRTPAGDRSAGASPRTTARCTRTAAGGARGTTRGAGPAGAAGVASSSGAAAVARSVGAASRGSHNCGIPL